MTKLTTIKFKILINLASQRCSVFHPSTFDLIDVLLPGLFTSGYSFSDITSAAWLGEARRLELRPREHSSTSSLSLPRHSLAAARSGRGPSHFSPETTQPNQPGQPFPSSWSVNLNEKAQLRRSLPSPRVSSHQCSEPAAPICPIRKRALGFRSRGTPTGGNQRPGGISQEKGSAGSCHAGRKCDSRLSGLLSDDH